jgi:hypothetical protein
MDASTPPRMVDPLIAPGHSASELPPHPLRCYTSRVRARLSCNALNAWKASIQMHRGCMRERGDASFVSYLEGAGLRTTCIIMRIACTALRSCSLLDKGP